MQRLCPRCRHAVTFDTDGGLIYCSNCGAPQVRLSEELLDQVATQQEALASGENPSATPATELDPANVDWKGAINCALLAGGIAFVLSLSSVALVPAVLLVFWLLTAPIVTLGIYSARFRETLIKPGFGARLGLLCGMAVILAMTLVNTSELLITRYVFHHAAAIDGQIAARYDQIRAAATQQPGPGTAEVIAWMDNPEKRAGLMMLGLATMSAVYLAFSAIGGAFAGLLRSHKPAR